MIAPFTNDCVNGCEVERIVLLAAGCTNMSAVLNLSGNTSKEKVGRTPHRRQQIFGRALVPKTKIRLFVIQERNDIATIIRIDTRAREIEMTKRQCEQKKRDVLPGNFLSLRYDNDKR